MKTTTQMKEAADLLQECKWLLDETASICDIEKPHTSRVLRNKARKIAAFQRRWSKSRKQPQ